MLVLRTKGVPAEGSTFRREENERTLVTLESQAWDWCPTHPTFHWEEESHDLTRSKQYVIFNLPM